MVWLARDRTLFHALGVFVATFMYSLSTLAWVDRAGSGRVPLLSCVFVGMMVVTSVLLLSVLVQRLNSFQITQVLRIIGDTGRDVIAQSYQGTRATTSPSEERPSLPVTLTVNHVGRPVYRSHRSISGD